MTPRAVIVPHTHWDREWYHSAARFQVRLAHLIDDVIGLLERGANLPAFLLDGQAVVLDDFAALRPEQADVLRRLLGEGRLEVGPWYVLADELLVSAEALVRNLLEGRRTARRHGGEPMMVGYSPDAFGHSGALPAILAGFGIRVAVAWRGLGGESGQVGDLFRWGSADGSEVLLVHLPPQGYENGANLPVESAALKTRWESLRAELAARARSPFWLVLSGADHHGPQPDLPGVVDALQKLAPDIEFRLGTLESYASEVRRWADAGRRDLPVVAGELTGGESHAWVLQGTHGSRLYLKQSNAACQRLLERVAEPLAALSSARGPAVDLRADLVAAWRALLENHPHDSICGTSHDAVHREMMTRFARCVAMGEEVVAGALDRLIGHDRAAARVAGRAAWRPGLAVFNPAAARRDALVEADVALFRADVRVGQAALRGGAGEAPRRPGALVIRSPDGTILAAQELDRRDGHDLVESPLHYPDSDAVEWRRVLVRVRDLPPLGVRVLGVEEAAHQALVPVDQPVRVSEGVLENRHVRLSVGADGTVALADRRSGVSASGLGALEDEADLGDSYTSSVRGGNLMAGGPDRVAVNVVHRGPLRGELEVVRQYESLDLEVLMRVALDQDSPLAQLRLSGINRRTDHRIRIAFPLGEPARRVVADGHFGPVERRVGARPAPAGAKEMPAPTALMQRYVAVAGDRSGLTVFSDGLPQYEVRRDGALLVTVLRAFGELSRPDLPERPGHAGWPTPTPEAQCLGRFGARLGVLLHRPRELDDLSEVEREGERFHAPPVPLMRRGLMSRPADVTGPALEGEGLVFSAMKPAEDGRAIVLRCYNSRATPTGGMWRLPWPVRAAQRCRLDETSLSELPVGSGGTVAFDAGPREVVTLRLTPLVSPPRG